MNDWLWYVTRSTGIVATVLMLASLAWGFLFSARETGTRLRPAWWLDLHKGLGGLAVVFTVVHLVAAFADTDLGVEPGHGLRAGRRGHAAPRRSRGESWRSTDWSSSCSRRGRRCCSVVARGERCTCSRSRPRRSPASTPTSSAPTRTRRRSRCCCRSPSARAVYPLGVRVWSLVLSRSQELPGSPEVASYRALADWCAWNRLRPAAAAARPAGVDRPGDAGTPRSADRQSRPPGRDRRRPGARLPPTGRTRKRHAAKGSRTAAVLMSMTTAAGLSAYFQHVDTAAASRRHEQPSPECATSPSGTATRPHRRARPAPRRATATTARRPRAPPSALADGTYTGATDTNKWGPVQVQITVTRRQDHQRRRRCRHRRPTARASSINARATPTLASEALSAQSANIDTVSGATYTSDSYKVSLQSAIDLARSTALQTAATP